jgi:hypothetical protein
MRWNGLVIRRCGRHERVKDDPNWNVHELDGAHDLMRDNLDDLLRILLDARQR